MWWMIHTASWGWLLLIIVPITSVIFLSWLWMIALCWCSWSHRSRVWWRSTLIISTSTSSTVWIIMRTSRVWAWSFTTVVSSRRTTISAWWWSYIKLSVKKNYEFKWISSFINKIAKLSKIEKAYEDDTMMVMMKASKSLVDVLMILSILQVHLPFSFPFLNAFLLLLFQVKYIKYHILRIS